MGLLCAGLRHPVGVFPQYNWPASICRIGSFLSLSEIALLLGYSEQSAFNRAFRRWTGLTPLAYQKQAVAR